MLSLKHWWLSICVWCLLPVAGICGEGPGIVKWDKEMQIGKTEHRGLALNNADAIVADAKGRVHIVWQNPISTTETTSTSQLSYMRLDDHGAQPGKAQVLGRADMRASGAGLAAGPGDIVDMVFDEVNKENRCSVAHIRSEDGGSTWSEVHTVTVSESAGERQVYSSQPAIYTDETGRVHVVWQRRTEQRSFNSFYASSSDGGRTWSKPVPIHNNPDEVFEFPSIDGSKGKLFFIYRAGRRGQTDVYFRSMDLATGAWSEPVMASDGEMRAGDPTIAVDDSGAVHVTYHRASVKMPDLSPEELEARKAKSAESKQSGGGSTSGETGKAALPSRPPIDPSELRVWSARSDDGGKTWARTQLGERQSKYPRAEAARGGWVAVFWEDGPLDKRTATGNIWDPKAGKWLGNLNANASEADAYLTQADLDDAGWLHVLWVDLRSGELEVYYRRGRVFEGN